MDAITSYAPNAPTSVLLGSVMWRVEALRDHQQGRMNPHLRDASPVLLRMMRAQVRAYLQELHARRVNLRERLS